MNNKNKNENKNENKSEIPYSSTTMLIECIGIAIHNVKITKL